MKENWIEASSHEIRFADQNLTLADAVGLHLLRGGAIASCWSTDRHRGVAGVPLAIHG